MKTVIMVWKNNTDLFKLIKTSCYLYNLSCDMKFIFYVDFQHHSISKCLPNPPHPYHKLILESKIPTIHDVDYYIKTTDSKLLFFYTPTYLFVNLNEDCKQFIRSLLYPPPPLVIKLKSIQVNTILHIHVNTPIISTFKQTYLMYTIYEKIKYYLSPTTIVLSDTHEIKQYIREQSADCIIFDTLIGNIGFEPHDEAISDTLFDLYLMTKAEKIFSFSWYNTIPGFVKIMSIYNIPIYEIKID